MPKTTQIVNAELEAFFTDAYIGIFTTKPTALAGTGGTEMSGGTPAYARVDLATYMGAAASRQIANDTLIEINTNNGTAEAIGIWDDPTAGNLKGWQEILQAVTNEDNTFETSGEGIEVIKLAQLSVRNVVVRNSALDTTYTEGTDYTVEYKTGRVVRITTGSITSGQAVKVSYSYPTTQATVSGVKFQIAVGALVWADKNYL